jgi:hypothetical protein
MMDDHITTKQEERHPTKLAFTSVAAPAPDVSGTSALAPYVLDDNVSHEDGPPATRKEVFSYYVYYAGNNGIGSFQ